MFLQKAYAKEKVLFLISGETFQNKIDPDDHCFGLNEDLKQSEQKRKKRWPLNGSTIKHLFPEMLICYVLLQLLINGVT